MNLRDLGEFGLVERIKQRLARDETDELAVGPGDDAAVWRNGTEFTIATTDTMVDGVHFLASAVPPEDVGWKALASNISDVAAMGGTPTFALVTLCLAADTHIDYVDALYSGIIECAEAHGVRIAGGDVVSAPTTAITIAVLGTAKAREDGAPAVLRRDAARPGDVVALTGTVGGSAAGLRALRDGFGGGEAVTTLIRRHMRPTPRILEGRAALNAGIACAIDISDGLVQDIGHICEAGGVAVDIQVADVPLDPAVSACYPEDAIELALTGGEDYELVLVGAEDKIAQTRDEITTPLTVIGRVVGARVPSVRLLDAAGDAVQIKSRGWEHFADRPRG